VGVTVGAGVGVGVTTADVPVPSLNSFLKVMKRVAPRTGTIATSAGPAMNHVIDDVRRILRKTPGADRIDPASGENIGGMSIYRHRDRAAIGASDLRKIPDPKKLVVRDGYFQRRTCDDSTLEWPGKDKARDAQEKETNQTTVHKNLHALSIRD